MEWRLWTNEAIGGRKPQVAWEQPVCQDAVLCAGADKQSRRPGWGSFRGTAAPVTAMFRVLVKPGCAHLQQFHKMHTKAGPPSFLLRPQSPAWQAERALTADSLPALENAQEPSRGSASLQAQDPGAGSIIDTFAKREGRKGGGQQGAETPSGGVALGGCAPPFWGLLPAASSLCSVPSPSSQPGSPPPCLSPLLCPH